MFDALLVVFEHPAAKRRLVDDLANILKYEVIGLKLSVGPETKTFLVGFDDRDVGVLFSLEALVLAVVSAIAAPVDALDFCRPVDAIRVFTTGMVLAVICRRDGVSGPSG